MAVVVEWEWGRRGGVGACGEGGNVVGVDEGGLGEERAEERWRRREGGGGSGGGGEEEEEGGCRFLSSIQSVSLLVAILLARLRANCNCSSLRASLAFTLVGCCGG